MVDIVKHPMKMSLFEHIAATQKIAAPLKKLGIDFFSYAECTKDNAFRGVINDGIFAENYFMSGRFQLDSVNTCRKEQAKNILLPPGLYLWDLLEGKDIKTFNSICKEYKLFHLCSIVLVDETDRTKKRSYNFATNDPNNTQILDIFFNKTFLLHSFIDYFQDIADEMITSSNWFDAQSERGLISVAELPISEVTKIEADFLRTINFEQYKVIINRKKLTNRESQCLNLIINGKSAKQMARTLKLSVRTIDAYIKSLKDKFHCRKQIELVAIALLYRCGQPYYLHSNNKD